MFPRNSLIRHLVPALTLPLIAIGASSVGTVETFQNWLLGNAALTDRSLPLLAASVVSIAILFHYFARAAGGEAYKATIAGTLIGFLIGILGNTFTGMSPLLVATLTAAGAFGGWAILPRS